MKLLGTPVQYIMFKSSRRTYAEDQELKKSGASQQDPCFIPYFKNSNKLIAYDEGKNTEKVSHKNYQNAQLFVKYALEFIVQYLSLLFTFIKIRLLKPMVSDFTKVIKRVLHFSLRHGLLCIKEMVGYIY